MAVYVEKVVIEVDVNVERNCGERRQVTDHVVVVKILKATRRDTKFLYGLTNIIMKLTRWHIFPKMKKKLGIEIRV